MRTTRFPVCFWSAILGVLIYAGGFVLAYLPYPEPFSPAANWLSDLGNPVDNPRGAFFYNAAVVLTAFLVGAWFIGLSQWTVPNSVANQRLLVISQAIGILSCAALVLSALNPINVPTVHAFWSQVHYLGTGIAFALSVAALRYHRRVAACILYLGSAASVWPSLTLLLGSGTIYWMEWIAVCLFILYLLSIGAASRALAFRAR